MRIPVEITPTHRHGQACHRLNEPITFGVPVPRGQVRSVDGWTLGPADGRSTAVDATVLDRWPDGTARWVLIDAQVTVDGGSTDWALDTTVGAGQPPAPGLTVEDTAERIAIDTGAARISFERAGRFPIAQVAVGGADLLAPTAAGLVVTDESGLASTVTVTSLAVEHRGPLRTAVVLHGQAKTGKGRVLNFTGRVECFAGHATVRVRLTIRNPDRAVHPGNYWDLGDPGSVLLKDVSLTLGLAGDRESTTHLSAEPDAPITEVAGAVEVYQDSSGGSYWQSTNHINRHRQVPNTFRGYRVRTGTGETQGLRATPLLSTRRNTRELAVAMPDFWQNFPKAVEADAGRLTVRLFPGQYADLHELQGGEQKTDECFLGFGPDATTEVPLDWCRNRLLARASPRWVLGSEAVDYLAPLDDGHRTLADQAIDGPDSFDAKREVIDEFGWRHFGEIYGDHEAIGHKGPNPLVSHYNNQYDPVAGFALQFLRSGDPRWWLAMDELARHVIDIDIYHTDKDKSAYNGGLFWHTYHYGDADLCTHRTYPKRNTGTVHGGGPSADHNYPTGLMLRYFLTGDVASREAAVGLAQYVLNLEDWRLTPFRWLSHADTGRAIFTPPDFYGPARSSGNSLNALVDGHRLTGNPTFLAKADLLVQRTIHPKDNFKRHRLDEPEYRWFYAMFLQALGKYLGHKASIGQLDRAYAHGRASLLSYARWMAEHEYPYLEKPEKLEYPNETWAAQDIRKADIFSHAAMHAAGPERDRFVERAGFFHRTSIATLLTSPTRSLARPVVVLLTSGIVWPWFAAKPAATLPPPAIDVDLGDPQRFVAQRAQAERRAKIIVALGAIAVVAAALAGVVWWLSAASSAI